MWRMSLLFFLALPFPLLLNSRIVCVELSVVAVFGGHSCEVSYDLIQRAFAIEREREGERQQRGKRQTGGI